LQRLKNNLKPYKKGVVRPRSAPDVLSPTFLAQKKQSMTFKKISKIKIPLNERGTKKLNQNIQTQQTHGREAGAQAGSD
jgi:hypothetical protein